MFQDRQGSMLMQNNEKKAKSKHNKDKQRQNVKMKQIEKLYRYEPSMKNIDSIIKDIKQSPLKQIKGNSQELHDLFNSIIM